MAADVQQTPFVKQLGSSDRSTRDKALDSLRTYLRNKRDLPRLELLKLWKGLFFSMWHSDKPLVQQSLAASLASLVLDVQPPLVLPFLTAFWTTMAREWGGIDVLRMDKFMFLVRKYVDAAWAYLSRHEWEKALVDGYLDILEGEGGPLSPGDRAVPDGLRYHVLDLWVDELEKTVGENQGSSAPVELFMRPVARLVKRSPNKAIRERSKNVLEDERVKGWEGGHAENVDDGKDDLEGDWEGFGE